MALFIAHPKVLHRHNDKKWNTQSRFRGFGLKPDFLFFFFFMEQINEGKTCVAQRVLTAPTAAPSKHVRVECSPAIFKYSPTARRLSHHLLVYFSYLPRAESRSPPLRLH